MEEQQLSKRLDQQLDDLQERLERLKLDVMMCWRLAGEAGTERRVLRSADPSDK